MLGFMDLKWPRVARRSKVGLVIIIVIIIIIIGIVTVFIILCSSVLLLLYIVCIRYCKSLIYIDMVVALR